MSYFSELQSLRCDCGMTHEEKEVYESMKFVLEGWIQTGINVFGFVANIVAMVALSSHQLKTRLFNRTLFILAIFDAVFNVLDVLESIRMLYYDKNTCMEKPLYQSLHLFLVPQILRPLRFYMIIASIHTTVLIAFKRYSAVSKPISSFMDRPRCTMKNLFQIIAPILITSFILTLPKSFEFYMDERCFLCDLNDLLVAEADINSCKNTSRIFTKSTSSSGLKQDVNDTNDGHYYQWVKVMQWSELFHDEIYILGYNNIVLNTITYLVPIIMLFLLNFLIYIHLKRRRKDIRYLGLHSLPLNNGSVPRKNQLQAIQELETKQLRILFGVCLLFIVCHTCRILLNIEDLYLRLINGIDPTKSRPCNEGCASYYSFWSHMMVTCNKILLAVSHSFNLIIYCLTSKSFRTTVYKSFIRSNPVQRPAYQMRDGFWTAATCIMDVQELMDQDSENIYISQTRRASVTHVVFKDGTSFLMRRQLTYDHRLAYLDLAVACHPKNENSTKGALENKRSLRFQKMLETRKKFSVYSLSNSSLF